MNTLESYEKKDNDNINKKKLTIKNAKAHPSLINCVFYKTD